MLLISLVLSMSWLVFSYSLPSKSQSSPRVALWRRLRRLGAISVKTGVHVLPARDECIEAFQWLAQEVQHAKGEALVIYVEQFEGLTDEQLIELFRAARQQEYAEINAQAEELEKTLVSNSQEEAQVLIIDKLVKLRKRYAEVLRLDFFNCPYAQEVLARLRRIEQTLREPIVDTLVNVTVAEYRDRHWVTRPRPFVDRLACAWLIRRFINPNAVIRYSLKPEPDEVAFDIKGAEFGHQNDLCSFEVMILRFELDKPELQAIAGIVHELDLRDGQYAPPEAVGVDTILRGWLLAGLADSELEARGIELFEGLYLTFSREKNP
jgi:hypothetical protein